MSPFISFVLVIFMKEGFGMKRVVLLAAVAVFSVLGLVTAEFAAAADAPAGPTGPADQIAGGKQSYKSDATATKTLKGRVWSQWADNPDGELLFGIQYWNTGEPASGTPAGRSSTDLDVSRPVLCSVAALGALPGGRKGTIRMPVGTMPPRRFVSQSRTRH